MTTEIKRVAIYLRVSTDEQAINGVSLDVQKEELLKHIKQRPFDYVINEKEHIYIDGGYSGASDDRPALRKMMMDAKNKSFDMVLVWKIDRFFRKTLHLLQYVEKLWNYGISFKSITQPFDVSNSYGKMILGVLGVIGELERDMIRERTASGKLQKAKMGYFVGGGSSKFGFDIVKAENGKKIQINEEEKQTITRIFNLFVNEKKSLGGIADILTQEKVKTKYDIEYENKKSYDKMKPCHWYPGTIRSILSETMYIGTYFYGKTYNKFNPDSGKIEVCYRSKGDPLLIELKCEKILEDESIFYKAQELLQKNKLTLNNKSSHLFTGLIICGGCGKHYIGYRSTKGPFSYRCGSMGKKSPKGCRCSNPQVSEKFLIDVIWKKINTLFINPDKELESYYKLSSNNSKMIESYEEELKKVESNLSKTNYGITQVYSEFYTETDEGIKNIKQGVINSFKEKLDSLNLRREELLIKLDKFKKIDSNKRNIKKIVSRFSSNLLGIATDKKKLELIKSFVESIKVKTDGNVIVSFRFDDLGGGGKGGKNEDNNGGNDNINDDFPSETNNSLIDISDTIPLNKGRVEEVKIQNGLLDVSSEKRNIPTRVGVGIFSCKNFLTPDMILDTKLFYAKIISY